MAKKSVQNPAKTAVTKSTARGGQRPGAGRKPKRAPTLAERAEIEKLTPRELRRRAMYELAARGEWAQAAKIASDLPDDPNPFDWLTK